MQLVNKKIKIVIFQRNIFYLGNLSLFKFQFDNCNFSGENWFINGNKYLIIIIDIK